MSRLEELLEAMLPEERREFDELLASDPVRWRPLPGPQTEAIASAADIVGFGGAAGGGKSDVAIGLALTQHQRVGFFRENGTELLGVIDRMAEILGSRDGYNGKDNVWRTRRPDGVPVQVELGSFPNLGDEEKYRGRPHDLLVFDECQAMRESAVRFLLGWLRSVDQKQRCRALLNFNPPTTVEGRWLIAFFAPWIDKRHPNPAKPGELRWFASIDGKDTEVSGPAPFEHGGERIVPQSRTFIPSRLRDNPHLANSGYMARLQALPEPLRSQLLHGDFSAGLEDDAMQVCPTKWVEAAMARWKRPDKLPPMDSLGADIAMGGRDNTILARRHGAWFDEPIVHPGPTCIDGATVAGFIVAALRDNAIIHLDLFGVGAQPYGHLMAMGVEVIGVNVGDPCAERDATGRLEFFNLRSMLWWRMRECLDPNANTGICLPPDPRLLADLCAATWQPSGRKIKVSSSDEVRAVVGRSPDFGSAFVLGLMATMDHQTREAIADIKRRHGIGGQPPYDYFASL